MRLATSPKLPELLKTIARHRAEACTLLSAIDVQQVRLARLLGVGSPGQVIDYVEDLIDKLRAKLAQNDVLLMDLVAVARVANERRRVQLDLDQVFRKMPAPIYSGAGGCHSRVLGQDVQRLGMAA